MKRFDLNLVPAQVQRAARLIQQVGGQANLIGGSVIDLIQGREPKDWDIEVFRVSFDQLANVFSAYAPKLTGKAFGVLKVVLGGVDLDISIPRRDNKTGVGHKGFTVEVDPQMTVAEAARRRDFTINSMAVNLHTGELYDPYNGLKDLQAGVLRATDPKLFVEDPLRALRAMQLLARKAKTVDPATLQLIRSIKHTYPELPKERVWEEWRKLLLKAKKPSVGLEFLRESEWIDHYPELQALVGLEQHPEWHPEGDVWTHSKMAADAFADIRDRVPEDMREPLAMGVFLHDLGKASTTVLPHHVKAGTAPAERLYTAWGHDKAGKPLSQTFMDRLGASDRTRTLASAIVEEHMQPWNLHQGEAEKSAYLRLAKRMQGAGGDLAALGYMSHCDACATGKPHARHETWASAASQRMFDMADELRKAPSMIQPRIQGRHLIAAGFKPGNAFAPALKAAFEAQMDNPGLTDDQLLVIAVSHLTAKKNPRSPRRRARTNPPGPEGLALVSPDGRTFFMDEDSVHEDLASGILRKEDRHPDKARARRPGESGYEYYARLEQLPPAPGPLSVLLKEGWVRVTHSGFLSIKEPTVLQEKVILAAFVQDCVRRKLDPAKYMVYTDVVDSRGSVQFPGSQKFSLSDWIARVHGRQGLDAVYARLNPARRK